MKEKIKKEMFILIEQKNNLDEKVYRKKLLKFNDRYKGKKREVMIKIYNEIEKELKVYDEKFNK
jgi:hypothetical protein